MRTELLEEIGLTKSEINVYLALLELGSSSTGKIVDKAKTSSSKIYEILDRLIDKGLVSFIVKSGVKYFEAAPPERIMDYMKEKEEKILKQKDELKNLLPELELRKRLSEYKSEATVYKGLKGVETAFMSSLDLLKEGETFKVIGIPSRPQALNRFFVRFNKERARRKIRAKFIFNEVAKGEIQTLPENNPMSETRFIPQVTPASINIFNDRIIIFPDAKEPLLFVIDSKEVAESFKVQFEMLWNQKIKTFEGKEQIKILFEEMIGFGDYDVFTEGDKLLDLLGENFFYRWQEEKKKRNIQSRGIISSKYRYSPHVVKATTQFKFIPEHKSPGETFIFNDKVVTLNHSKEPVAFLIEDKNTADSNRVYFELLWNQKIRTYEGKEQIKELFIETLGFGDYDTMAEGMKIIEILGKDFFLWWQEEKNKKGIKSRGIMGEKYKKLLTVTGSVTNFRFIPGFENPGVTMIFSDKIVTINFTKKPVAFLIENKESAMNQRTYFELLWDQTVQTFKGQEQVEMAYERVLEDANKDEDVIVFAAKPKTKRGADYNLNWNKEINKLTKGVRLLYYGDTETNRERVKSMEKLGPKAKILPTKEELPISTVVSKDKVVNTIWTKDPISFLIKNKTLADSFKANFDLLWNQEVTVQYGEEGCYNAFNTMIGELKKGDEYYVLGASWQRHTEYVQEFFIDFHRRRQEKGIRSKLLFTHGTENIVKENKATYGVLSEVKFLPPGIHEGIQFNLFNDSILIFVWRPKEPIVFRIDDKEVFKTFKTYFDNLWNQDTTVTKGWDALKDALYGHIDSIETGDSYRVLGASFGAKGLSEKYTAFFKGFHVYRKKHDLRGKILFQQGNEQILKDVKDEYYDDCELKTLPYKVESPVVIFPYKEKTIMTIQENEPVVITINNKEITTAFERQFDMLWNQETRVIEGIEAIEGLFEEMFTLGGYDTIGSRGYMTEANPEFIKRFREKMIKNKIKVRNITDYKVKGTQFSNYEFIETRYNLPEEFSKLSNFFIYGKSKVAIVNWMEKEPTAILIDNHNIHDTYQQQFESLWNQETYVMKGVDAVQFIFEDMIEHDQVDLIGARGYFVDERPEFIKEWEKRAIEKGFKIRNIVDPEVKGHKITKFSFAKTKYTLQKEFSNLSVFWIYGGKVVISNWMEKEPTVIMIENKNLYEVYKRQFELLWKQKDTN